MKSNIRLKKSGNAQQERLKDLKEKYNIPLKWAEKLPVRERGCTDCCCLILFLLVVVAMIASTVFIMTNSDSERLTRLYDSSGNDCGTEETSDYPFLYMQTFKKPYRSVCVKECPKFDYNEIRFNSDGSLDKEEEPVQTDDGLDDQPDENNTEAPPADDSTSPADDSTPPTDDSTSPADDSTPPTDDSTPPADDSTPPTDDSTPPADDSTPPADDSTPPPERILAEDTGDSSADSNTTNTTEASTDTQPEDSNTETPTDTQPEDSNTEAPADTQPEDSNSEAPADENNTADEGAEVEVGGGVGVESEEEAEEGAEEETEEETPEEKGPPTEPPLDKDGNMIPMYFSEFSSEWSGRPVARNRDMQDDEIFGWSPGFINEYFTEEQWDQYLSERVKLECSPNDQVTSCDYKKGETWIYDSYPVLGIVCAPLAPKTALFFFRISSKINHGSIGDLMESWKIFVYVALISLAVSLIFLILTRFCGKLIIIILATLTVLALLTLGITVLVHYYVPSAGNVAQAHLHLKYQAFLKKNKTLFIVLAVCSILLSLILIVMLCKFKNELNLAYPVLEIAAHCSISNVLLILLSIFIVICQFFVLFFEIYVVMRLYVMGEEHNDIAEGSPFVYYETNSTTKGLLALHIFGTYWVIIFLNNFNDFINASISVNYYFDTKLNNLNIFCHTLGHNCGSVAWSIILLPVYLIKLVLGPIKWLATSEDPNALQRCCNSVCNCCCKCYEFFFDCISESYMPLCYMGSENFNTATRRHYFLTELYYDESNTVSTLGTIYNWLGRTVITIFSGYCGILIIQSNDELEQNVKNMGLVFFICFFIAFILGSLMINIFSTAYDTLFVCFLVEKNLFDQYKEEGRTYDLQAREDIESAFLKVISDSDDYQKLEDA